MYKKLYKWWRGVSEQCAEGSEHGLAQQLSWSCGRAPSPQRCFPVSLSGSGCLAVPCRHSKELFRGNPEADLLWRGSSSSSGVNIHPQECCAHAPTCETALLILSEGESFPASASLL